MSKQKSFCTFRVGSMHFGVEVELVQEVIRQQAMTPVPGASDVVRGLMNLRGQIVTALDLQRRLGLPETPGDEPGMNVVVRGADSPISLLVHEIGDVCVVESESFEQPPETLQGVHRDLILGAYKLESGLLLVLNTESVLELAA